MFLFLAIFKKIPTMMLIDVCLAQTKKKLIVLKIAFGLLNKILKKGKKKEKLITSV